MALKNFMNNALRQVSINKQNPVDLIVGEAQDRLDKYVMSTKVMFGKANLFDKDGKTIEAVYDVTNVIKESMSQNDKESAREAQEALCVLDLMMEAVDAGEELDAVIFNWYRWRTNFAKFINEVEKAEPRLRGNLKDGIVKEMWNVYSNIKDVVDEIQDYLKSEEEVDEELMKVEYEAAAANL